MATVIMVTSRVLTHDEAESRRKRMAALIEEAELELKMKEEDKVKVNEQLTTDI